MDSRSCSRRRRAFARRIALALALATPLPALAIGLAPEASGQANTEIAGVQREAAVAAAPDGRFVVVWSSVSSTGGDNSLDSIQAQRFDANGNPVGGQFQVNAFTIGSQLYPAVAMDDYGTVYVAWQSDAAPIGEDGSLSSIRMRAFDPDGIELFPEEQVNDTTFGAQILPAMAFVDGTLVVTWQSGSSPGSDASQDSIQARRFAADGTPLGPQFQVNATTLGLQSAPAIGAYPGRGFVVAWGSDEDPSGSYAYRVRARRLAASGAMGSELLVDAAPGAYPDPAVAMSDRGSFTVAWVYSSDSSAPSPSLGIRARAYNADDAPLAAAFAVNDYVPNDQVTPAITYISGLMFVVSWQSDGSNGTDVSSHSVQLRLFTEPGQPDELQEQINLYTFNQQNAPAIAFARGNGRVVVGWESNGSAGTDDQLTSIQWRSYHAPSNLLFADGFELGSKCRWAGQPILCFPRR